MESNYAKSNTFTTQVSLKSVLWTLYVKIKKNNGNSNSALVCTTVIKFVLTYHFDIFCSF